MQVAQDNEHGRNVLTLPHWDSFVSSIASSLLPVQTASLHASFSISNVHHPAQAFDGQGHAICSWNMESVPGNSQALLRADTTVKSIQVHFRNFDICQNLG